MTKKNATNFTAFVVQWTHSHGMMIRVLVDFVGFIVAVVTAILGHLHDTTTRQAELISKIGKEFALTDCAYSGLDFCVAGFKGSQPKDEKRIKFDAVSRSEQVVVEHVNAFFKKAKSVSKETTFHHSIEVQAACVLICSGLYNFRKLSGDYE